MRARVIEVLLQVAAVTPWLVLGADLQIIRPSLANETAIFPGLRTVIRF